MSNQPLAAPLLPENAPFTPAQRSWLNGFLDMLAAERGAAKNTIEAYERDLEDYLGFAVSQGGPAAVTADDVRAYLVELSERGLKASSAARRLSAVRQFHRFLYTEGLAGTDPTAAIEGPLQQGIVGVAGRQHREGATAQVGKGA